MALKSVRSRPNRPNRASETSELSIRHSDGEPDFGRKPDAFPVLGGGGLIDRMTLEAETDRAAYPYGIATFVDEPGVITHVNISKDPIAAMDRIEKRLGLTPQPAARQARGVSR